MQILNEWMKDIPQQFLGKHNIEVLIKAFARQMQEIQQVFDDMKTKLDLDTATGQNLDYVGTIIPLSRKEAGELAGINVTDPVISDDRYRQYLRYKNLVNTNECTYYDLMDGLSLLWDVSPIYYIEDPAMPATIILTMPFLKPGGEVVTLGEVPMVKPAGVQIQFQYLIRVAIEILSKWIWQTYTVPLCDQYLCGQYPRRGSLGEIMYVQTDIDMIEMQSVFEIQKSGTIRVGGTLYNSTTGEVVSEDVEVVINSQYKIEQVILAGQELSGTYPIQSVNGLFLGSSTEASSSVTTTKANLPLSGTETSGGGVMETAEATLVSEETSVYSNVHVVAAVTEVCGPNQVGEATLTTVSESVEAEPVIQIVKATVTRCGVAACGNK